VASPRPSASAALAHLVVRSGALQGQRLAIRTPVVNVGRADYNDLILPDDSVSTVHAKFQRREGIWVIVDLESTNGTFVDGERIPGEATLAPGALIRFGEVRAFFEPADHDEPVKGGSTKLMQALKLPTDKP
jgi:pSer/pThr/pTyr-binding forkhead associated (FHA) protein